MGQYWDIVNIDKHQQFGSGGDLSQYLFGGISNELVGYLAVPFLTTTATPSSRWSLSKPSSTGTWAGDRIICVGDSGSDVPEGILDEDETREFARLTQRDEYGDIDPDDSEDEDGSYNLDYINLNKVAGEYFEDCRRPKFSRDGLAQGEYILRNLTKREYVRHDAINIHRDESEGPFLNEYASEHRPGLGDALMSQICWSISNSSGILYDYGGVGITRGAWAGDRFDIQPIDVIRNETRSTGQWKDVSKEVAEKVFEIWTAQFEGESWKEGGRERRK